MKELQPHQWGGQGPRPSSSEQSSGDLEIPADSDDSDGDCQVNNGKIYECGHVAEGGEGVQQRRGRGRKSFCIESKTYCCVLRRVLPPAAREKRERGERASFRAIQRSSERPSTNEIKPANPKSYESHTVFCTMYVLEVKWALAPNPLIEPEQIHVSSLILRYGMW